MKFQGISEIILKSVKKDRYEKYRELLPDFKSEKNAKLITIILTISASIILGVFALNPTLSTIVGLQKQLDDSKLYEAALQQKISNLSILEQKYKSLEKDLPIVYDAVPRTSQVATLTATLQAIVASTSAVTLNNLQIVKVGLSKDILAGQKYSSFEYDVSIQGDYGNMLGVIDQLLNFQRILTISDVSFVKSTLKTQPTLQSNISGNAYFQP